MEYTELCQAVHAGLDLQTLSCEPGFSLSAPCARLHTRLICMEWCGMSKRLFASFVFGVMTDFKPKSKDAPEMKYNVMYDRKAEPMFRIWSINIVASLGVYVQHTMSPSMEAKHTH